MQKQISYSFSLDGSLVEGFLTSVFEGTTYAGISPMTLYFIALVLPIIAIVTGWKIFTKAGEPGWTSLIPIYNIFVMLRMAKLSPALFLLLFFPVANVIVALVTSCRLAKAFGCGALMMLASMLFPFVIFPILAFGSAEYDPNNL